MSVVLDAESVVLDAIADAPACEAPHGCDSEAVARFVVLCPCRKMRLGCDEHIAVTVEYFEECQLTCTTCGMTAPDFRVVPL